MTKDALTDYDPDPDNNTELEGTGIRGSNFVRNFDNGLRIFMSHIAKLMNGTAPASDAMKIGYASDLTANIQFDCSGITTATTRTVTWPDTDVTLQSVGTSDSPQFTGIELGHATDTTVTRSSAGRMAVEGSDVAFTSEIRDKLTANRTYYVDGGSGSDSNDGLSSGAGAFATLQKAANVIAGLDLDIYNVTVNVADGTYTAGVTFSGVLIGSGSVTLSGNTSTPANCVISTTSASCIVANKLSAINVQGFKLQTTTAGVGLVATNGGIITLTGAMDFGACANWHMSAAGGNVVILADYTISGGAQMHYYAEQYGLIFTPVRTVTLTGTPAFSTAFAFAFSMAQLDVRSMTFSGSATGTRYSVSQAALINTAGGGATYLPGNAAGSATAPGNYI